MDGQRYDSAQAIASIGEAASARREHVETAPVRSRSRAARQQDEKARTHAWHGVPMTSRVAAAMESYSFAGVLAAIFAFAAGVLAHGGVVDDAPMLHPFAALAIIASGTVLVGVRIRLLSVMEEACIAGGCDEDEAKVRARAAMHALSRRRREGDDR